MTTPEGVKVPETESIPPVQEGFSRRPAVACAFAGILVIAIRLALLPWLGVPIPRIHDEFSYLFGAETFASGRLTNPSHPLWVHFETFHVNMRPTYASKYPPGQALFLAAGGKLTGQPWAGVCLSEGLMFAALCWMLQGWVGRGTAFAATLLAMPMWGFAGYWMNSYWGGAVAALGGALVIGSLPRLARRSSFATVIPPTLGIILLMNTRPFEGAMTVAACAVVLLLLLRRAGRPIASLFVFRPVLVAVLLVAASLAAMGYYNYRVTGNPRLLPYVVNEREYAASPRFYFLPPIKMPVYHHESIRRLWEWDRNLYEAARANPLAVLQFAASSSGPFYLFNLIGVAALAGLFFGRRTIVLPAVLIFAVPMTGVLMEKAFQEHYLAPMCGAWLLLAAAAMEVAGRWNEKGRKLIIAVVGLSFGMSAPVLVQQARAARTPQGIYNRPLLIQRLEGQGGRHLVIVHYSPQHNAFEEWVYNRTDIDHASVVWALDMGDQQNRELLDYYKDRKVWMLNPDTDPLALQPYDSGRGPG